VLHVPSFLHLLPQPNTADRMQALASRTAQRAAVARKAAPASVQRAVVRPGAVRCQASLKVQELAKKAAAAVAAAPVLLASSPAFALVDDRLNGDGTGLPLGINDPALGFIFVGVLGTIWALYFNAQKDFGDFEDDESGLGL